MNQDQEVLTLLSRAFWIALGSAALFAMPVYRTLLSLKSRQIVSEFVPEHAKKQGTPTMGGLIIVIGFLIACGCLQLTEMVSGPLLPAAMLLCAGFAFIGFLDDFIVPRLIEGKRGLGWKQKLLLELLITGATVYWLRHGHGDFKIGAFVAVFVILFFSNAYNFVDGMDGLAGTILVLLAGGLVALGFIEMRQDVLMVLCIALIGAVIPFLVLNAPPAKVFMGDVGSLPIGAVLGLVVNEMMRPGVQKLPSSMGGALSVMPAHPLTTVLQNSLPLVVISFVMIAELVPVPLQIASVKLRKKRIFPKTPIHHAFESAGWPESRVVWLFCLVQFFAVAVALSIAIANPVIPR